MYLICNVLFHNLILLLILNFILKRVILWIVYKETIMEEYCCILNLKYQLTVDIHSPRGKKVENFL